MSDTKVKTRKSADERRAEADQLHESIGSQLEELTSTEGWARFLAFATGFHSYSLSNVLLILSQRPDASRVAGFRQWQERGRQVRKGERSIKIFGYATKRTEDENGEEERRAYFPILSVFDVSQTDSIDGEEIPELAPRLIGGDDAGIYDAAAEWLTGQGWSIDRASTGEANGFTQQAKRTITIHDELQPAQAAATMLHEAAHALMHAAADDYHQHGASTKPKPSLSPTSSRACSDSTPAARASATSPDGQTATSKPSRAPPPECWRPSERSSTGSPRTTRGNPRRLPPQRATRMPRPRRRGPGHLSILPIRQARGRHSPSRSPTRSEHALNARRRRVKRRKWFCKANGSTAGRSRLSAESRDSATELQTSRLTESVIHARFTYRVRESVTLGLCKSGTLVLTNLQSL